MPGQTRNLPEDLLPRFGLAPGRLAPEHPLPGSPERAVERYAVADAQGRPWLLERIAPGQAERREELAGLLAGLMDGLTDGLTDGLARDTAFAALVPAWLPVPKAAPTRHILRLDEPPNTGLWMLSPFVPGLPLPRPDYLDQAWRGRALAEALLALQRAGAALGPPPAPPLPALSTYAGEFFAALARRAPRLLPRLAPVRRALEGLAEAEAACPAVLAHGDPHPLNVIWGGEDRPVRALIDWEFAGARPRLYDAAVVLGCAGFEHPSGLMRGFALAFARALAEGGLPERELRLLPLFALALRLGWLAEWLRKKDAEMLDMELDYLDILLAAQARLARAWAG